jgi:hypothetical protein
LPYSFHTPKQRANSAKRKKKGPRVALPPDNPNPEASKRADSDARQQDALLREVDDAYRQDQLARFAKNHGTKVGVVVVIALLAFGGYLVWKDRRDAAHEVVSENLVKAMDQLEAGNFATATKQLNGIEKEGTAGAATVARLARAGAALSQDRKADAARIYGEVANDGDAPQPYRDLALIRQISLVYPSKDMTASDVVNKMKPLAKPGAPFFGSAGELLGAAYLDLGKPELAGPLFAQIAKDDTVPDSLRSRARQLSGLMGVDAIVDVDQTLKELQTNDAQQAPAGAQ